jgi:hypothetical protein
VPSSGPNSTRIWAIYVVDILLQQDNCIKYASPRRNAQTHRVEVLRQLRKGQESGSLHGLTEGAIKAAPACRSHRPEAGRRQDGRQLQPSQGREILERVLVEKVQYRLRQQILSRGQHNQQSQEVHDLPAAPERNRVPAHRTRPDHRYRGLLGTLEAHVGIRNTVRTGH